MSKAKEAIQYALITVGILMGFGILAITALVVLVNMLTPSPWDDRVFDREVWFAHAHDGKPDNPRGPMLEDLKKTALKNGMTREEVLALLGEPDYELPSETMMRYRLGSWSGMRMDPDSLDIEFGRDGKVRRIFRSQH